MGSFFTGLHEFGYLPSLAAVFDWLFSEHRFDGAIWNSNAKGRFTKELKRLDGFGSSSFLTKSAMNEYPVLKDRRNRKRKPYALFSSGGSIGESFVRHIRNAIAHGHAELYKVKGCLYIQMTDYDVRGNQTAYISMPLAYLNDIRIIYSNLEKSQTKSRKTNRS